MRRTRDVRPRRKTQQYCLEIEIARSDALYSLLELLLNQYERESTVPRTLSLILGDRPHSQRVIALIGKSKLILSKRVYQRVSGYQMMLQDRLRILCEYLQVSTIKPF